MLPIRLDWEKLSSVSLNSWIPIQDMHNTKPYWLPPQRLAGEANIPFQAI